jgi:arylsulfatase A-like enzyme
MTIRHEKMPAEDAQFYNDLARLPNDMPTLRNYYSQMSLVDQGVGRVLEALERANLSDETLIIYTSDHGMSLGQHGFWGHGEDTWPSNTHREANHIPLIVKAPDSGRRKSVVDSLVGTTDIYATILDYTVGQMPTAEQSPARSLRNLIESETADWDDVVFMEQEETRSIRTPEWLLMKRFGPTCYDFNNELYDLVADPDERNNLADDPDYDSTLTALAKKIDAYFAQYSNQKWDLWNGGTVKSNSTRPFLWREVWGDSWKPGY